MGVPRGDRKTPPWALFWGILSFLVRVIIKPVPRVVKIIRGPLMRPKWPKLNNLAQNISFLHSWVDVFIALKGYSFKDFI